MNIDPLTQALLDDWFKYHPPQADQAERYTMLRAAAKEYAQVVAQLCPAGADRDRVFQRIREASFLANASIACAPLPTSGRG